MFRRRLGTLATADENNSTWYIKMIILRQSVTWVGVLRSIIQRNMNIQLYRPHTRFFKNVNAFV